MRSLVLGLGNPIMADDSIGIHVVRMIQTRLHGRPDIVVKELSVSGIRLVEEILGFDHVIIVDSHTGKETESGRIRKFTPADFTDTLHPGGPHGINFITALEFYKSLEPDRIPKSIEIYTIDIDSELSFGENVSATVEKAGKELVDLLVRELTST
jgi:hydrogenase maturation protease